MLKCTIMLPVNYNDGKSIAKDAMQICLDGLLRIAGGYTLLPECIGAYRMDSGAICQEPVTPVWVCVEPDKLPDIKRWCQHIAETLEQECVYLETCVVNINFLAP